MDAGMSVRQRTWPPAGLCTCASQLIAQEFPLTAGPSRSVATACAARRGHRQQAFRWLNRQGRRVDQDATPRGSSGCQRAGCSGASQSDLAHAGVVWAAANFLAMPRQDRLLPTPRAWRPKPMGSHRPGVEEDIVLRSVTHRRSRGEASDWGRALKVHAAASRPKRSGAKLCFTPLPSSF